MDMKRQSFIDLRFITKQLTLSPSFHYLKVIVGDVIMLYVDPETAQADQPATQTAAGQKKEHKRSVRAARNEGNQNTGCRLDKRLRSCDAIG